MRPAAPLWISSSSALHQPSLFLSTLNLFFFTSLQTHFSFTTTELPLGYSATATCF
jgi:hypothetical protein